jgi:signal transduction histidine kinase
VKKTGCEISNQSLFFLFGKLSIGIGIPKDEIPYLFEKFSRGKDVGRLNAGGTGLGLHVGIKMIEELHGRIWIESEGAGKGSTFFVELPVG